MFFEMYYIESRSPSKSDLSLIEDAGHIAEMDIQASVTQE
jgi:hypothetical protein